jgi:hypothetical protein
VVCDDVDELDDTGDEDDDEDAVAVLETSSSRALDDDFVTVDEPEDPDDPEVAAAVEVVPGAWAANQAARPRNDAALTAPVMRRARRAGWRFGVVMDRSCARPRKTT